MKLFVTDKKLRKLIDEDKLKHSVGTAGPVSTATIETPIVTPSYSAYDPLEELDRLRDMHSECSINFTDPSICVFSIERTNVGTKEEATVVGYYIKVNGSVLTIDSTDGILHEWSLKISRRQHKELINKWLLSLGTPIIDWLKKNVDTTYPTIQPSVYGWEGVQTAYSGSYKVPEETPPCPTPTPTDKEKELLLG